MEPREQLPKVSFVETLQVQLLPLPARALIRCTYSKTLAMTAVAVIDRYARWNCNAIEDLILQSSGSLVDPSIHDLNAAVVTSCFNVLQLKSNFQIIGLTFICTDSTPC